MDKNEKKALLDKHKAKSPFIKDFAMAYLFGGSICVIGELIKRGLISLNVQTENVGTLTTIIMIFIASILTGLGAFDMIAKHAGAGTLVPVTGFSNAVTSQAMDAKSEGIILGVGAKIFTVAGPVILFGIASGVAYGLVYFMVISLTSG
jgi:stage V sporulation protein AC